MEVINHGLIVIVHSESQIELLKKIPKHYETHCWVKFDSGMHRLGLHADELNRVLIILNSIYT